MRILKLLILLVSGAQCVSAQNQWLQFDVAGGSVAELFRMELQPNSGVECQFRVSDWRYLNQWGPSFSVVMAEKDDLGRDVEGQRLVQLSMTIAESDGGRAYSVDTQGLPEPYGNAFLGLLSESEEHTVRLAWRDDGVFSYVASEIGNGFGQGYILEPRIEPRTAIVTVSGMSGQASCFRYEI